MSQTTSSPSKESYKLIARTPFHPHELRPIHTLLSSLVGPMHQGLQIFHTHDLTSPAQSTTTLVSSTNLSPQDTTLLSAKQRIQSFHLILHQTFKNSGYSPDNTDNGAKRSDKQWPRPLGSAINGDYRVVPLWTKVYFGMTDDGVRVARNYFAHKFGVSRGLALEAEEKEEVETFQWVERMYEELVPAVGALVEKLEEAMEEEGGWLEGKPGKEERNWEEVPGYSRDLDEVEASWKEWLEHRAKAGEDVEEDEEVAEEPEEEIGEGEDVDTNVDDEIQPTDSPETEAPPDSVAQTPGPSFSVATYLLNTLFKLKFAHRFATNTVDALHNQLLTMQGRRNRAHWIEHGRDVYQPETDVDIEAQWEEAEDFDEEEEEEVEQEPTEPVVQTEWVDNAPW